MDVEPNEHAADALSPEERGWTKQGSGLILPPPRRSGLPERVQEWATRIGSVAAAGAGLVIVVHLLGGVVMWLRFKKAGLPADQAVAFMSREELLTVGLRLIVLPAIATCLLALALVWAHRRRAQRGRPARGSRPALLACIAIVVVLFVSLPVSWASVTWIGLGLVLVYWWRGFGLERRPPGQAPSQWRLAAVAVLAAAVITLGRQIDEPVQLLQVDVALEGGKAPITGTFVSLTGDALFLGDTDAHQIRGYRRDDVRSVALGPPLERAPNRSLLSMLLAGPRWAITPARWWCNGESYSWRELSRLCATQPSAVAERRALDIRWIPVRVDCPPKARTRCKGYLRFTTAQPYSRALGRYATPRRVSFPRAGVPAVAFEVPAGRRREFCVPTSPQERALLRAAPHDETKAPFPVPLKVVFSADARGQTVLTRDDYRLDMTPSGADASIVPASDCSAALRRREAARTAFAAPAEAAGVEDGDTIIVLTGSRRVRQRVYLLGIAAPQTEKIGTPVCGQREGTDVLLRRLFSAPQDIDGDGLADKPGGTPRALRLVPDRRSPDRDDRSRPLRYVTVAGEERTLQEDLLDAGWARPQPGRAAPLAHDGEFAAAARSAKAAGRDLDKAC